MNVEEMNFPLTSAILLQPWRYAVRNALKLLKLQLTKLP
jgi:hypothetical protein